LFIKLYMLNSAPVTPGVCRTKHVMGDGSDVPYHPVFFLLCYIKKMQSSVLLSPSANKLLNTIHIHSDACMAAQVSLRCCPCFSDGRPDEHCKAPCQEAAQLFIVCL